MRQTFSRRPNFSFMEMRRGRPGGGRGCALRRSCGPPAAAGSSSRRARPFVVSVDSNGEEDAQKAVKMHPICATGTLKVESEE